MILLLNGAFGIGKTTVARLLVARMERAMLFDPEWIGIALQRVTRVDDFQGPAFVAAADDRRLADRAVVPPQRHRADGDLESRIPREIRDAVQRFEPSVVHLCLVAPVEEVHARLRTRGDAGAWEFRRAV